MPPSWSRWKAIFIEKLEAVEVNSSLWTLDQKQNCHVGTLGVLILACVSLSLLEYFGSSSDYDKVFYLFAVVSEQPGEWIDYIFETSHYGRLAQLTYWSGFCFLGYALLPALFIKFVLSDSISDYGLSVENVADHAWIYVLMYLCVAPLIFGASMTESFQQMYPFYDEASRSVFDFVAWQFLYAAQFVFLEFFFRGFLIHGLKQRFGIYAIAVSTLPYCMIHFGKPFPETMGAIIAGIALGGLSLFTGSIWLGAAIHISVAMSMDVLAIFWASFG